mmetsp:Transcript_31081/g.90957  ORF Transcript_31081/g.90957 Transcript_31081/m.90957 type:complete len:225 (+) Transcript_31081:739-1413(+)
MPRTPRRLSGAWSWIGSRSGGGRGARVVRPPMGTGGRGGRSASSVRPALWRRVRVVRRRRPSSDLSFERESERLRFRTFFPFARMFHYVILQSIAVYAGNMQAQLKNMLGQHAIGVYSISIFTEHLLYGTRRIGARRERESLQPALQIGAFFPSFVDSFVNIYLNIQCRHYPPCRWPFGPDSAPPAHSYWRPPCDPPRRRCHLVALRLCGLDPCIFRLRCAYPC